MRRVMILSLLLLTPLAIAVGAQRAGDPAVKLPPGVEVVVVEPESTGFVIEAESG